MAKKVIAKEPLFNFLDIHVSEIEKHPNALQDMLYNRSFEGMIIRDVLPKDVVEQVLSRLKNEQVDMNDILDSKFAQTSKGAYSLGENIVFTNPNLQQYFDSAAIFRQKCRTLFEGMLDFEALIASMFCSLSGGFKVKIPSGPQGETYIPATIRKLPTDHEYPIHVGNDFLNSPQSEHLRSLVDVSDQLSFFIPLVLPEAGGELVVYGLEWDDEKFSFENTISSRNPHGSRLYQEAHHIFEEQYGSMTFNPGIGDMMLFDGGRFYHSIVPTVGDRTRITIGGFLSFSKDHDTIYYWS